MFEMLRMLKMKWTDARSVDGISTFNSLWEIENLRIQWDIRILKGDDLVGDEDLDQGVIVVSVASLAVVEANRASVAANPVTGADRVKSADHEAALDHREVNREENAVHDHGKNAVESHLDEAAIMNHHVNRLHGHVNDHDRVDEKLNVKSHDRHHANHQLAG